MVVRDKESPHARMVPQWGTGLGSFAWLDIHSDHILYLPAVLRTNSILMDFALLFLLNKNASSRS
jgi:hypothetical protein